MARNVDSPLSMSRAARLTSAVTAWRTRAPAIKSWTEPTLPAHWQRQRDRWASVHIVRVVAGIAGLGLLVAGALYG